MNDVLIVEDHPFVAEATRQMLDRHYRGLNIVVCTSARAASEALVDPTRNWHRILLDLDIPGAHGLSYAREVKAQNLAGIACVVTANDRPDFIALVRKMGFLGYVIKAQPVAEFASALEKVFVGEKTFPQSDQVLSKELPRLTKRQTEILNLIRVGCSSRDIGARLELSEGTINNHVTAIFAALDVSSRSHAVAKAIEIGILGLTPDDQFNNGSC